MMPRYGNSFIETVIPELSIKTEKIIHDRQTSIWFLYKKECLFSLKLISFVLVEKRVIQIYFFQIKKKSGMILIICKKEKCTNDDNKFSNIFIIDSNVRGYQS